MASQQFYWQHKSMTYRRVEGVKRTSFSEGSKNKSRQQMLQLSKCLEQWGLYLRASWKANLVRGGETNLHLYNWQGVRTYRTYRLRRPWLHKSRKSRKNVVTIGPSSVKVICNHWLITDLSFRKIVYDSLWFFRLKLTTAAHHSGIDWLAGGVQLVHCH